jgi:hypothetical protein
MLGWYSRVSGCVELFCIPIFGMISLLSKNKLAMYCHQSHNIMLLSVIYYV